MNLLDATSAGNDNPQHAFCNWMKERHERTREAERLHCQAEIQQGIEAVERGHKGCRQIRSLRIHTYWGTITVKRRIFEREDGSFYCPADQVLGLPSDPWLPEIKELCSALGICTEFAHAQALLERVTGIHCSPQTIANQVEAAGEMLAAEEKQREPHELAPLDSAWSRQVRPSRILRRLYVGADGIMVPLNQSQGYKEGKVGVIFWEDDHLQVSKKRAEIRRREYIATMDSRDSFVQRLYQRYSEVAGAESCQVVILGDGAKWIWEMAAELFPESTQVLDFYHVMEYVWAVAKAKWPEWELEQRRWAKRQQELLKESRWQEVIAGLTAFKNPTALLKEAIRKLKRYLRNNAERIDYKRYLSEGIMIGSGVVESSNRRVVTQRLKQSGMYWSKRGADSIMALRACYLSSSKHWRSFWESQAA